MEVLLRFVLLFLATSTILVTADSVTSHYLGCLHESQCQKLFKGAYCCPTGTCCHFFVRDSSKFMSRCKRIRPAQTMYCQDGDKFLLSDKDLLDRRFFHEYPPNKGVVCIQRTDYSKFCVGGTDSEEEEFKAQGIQMTERDAVVSRIQMPRDDEIVRSEIKDMDRRKFTHYVEFVTRKFLKGPWIYDGQFMDKQ